MSEIKTKFPVDTTVKTRFPVAKEGKPDTLSSSILQGYTTKKYNKADVNFESPASGMDKCSQCFSFQANWSCNKVNGMVRPNDWCNEFTKLKGMGLPIESIEHNEKSTTD